MCTDTCVRELYRACTEPVLATDGFQRDDFPIFAKCGGGRIIALKVVPESTCSSVKLELGRRLKRCLASFRVVTRCGKELRGGRHISEYNIRSGSNLELSEFLLGGMLQERTVPIASLSCPQSAAPAALPNAVSVGANLSVVAFLPPLPALILSKLLVAPRKRSQTVRCWEVWPTLIWSGRNGRGLSTLLCRKHFRLQGIRLPVSGSWTN